MDPCLPIYPSHMIARGVGWIYSIVSISLHVFYISRICSWMFTCFMDVYMLYGCSWMNVDDLWMILYICMVTN